MSDTTQTPAVPDQAVSFYYNLLGALRGLAVLGVVFYHLSHAFRVQAEQPHASLGWLLPIFNGGWFGVDVFFLISGYGLAAKLAGDRRLTGINGARAFARNRFWRIYPVYWFCCLAVVLLAYAAHFFNQQDWRAAFPDDLGGVLASMLLIEPLTRTPPILPIVTWALSCEVGFYAVVLLGIMARPRPSDAILVSAATALAFVYLAGRMPMLGWLFAFWPQFACGLLLFAAVRQRQSHAPGAGLAALPALAALAVAAAVSFQWRITGTAAVGLLLVALKPFDQRLCRQPQLRWLAWCGSISFPLFLLHVPIGSCVMNLGRRALPAESAAFVLVIIAAVLAATMAAWAVHRWIERPTHVLAKRPSSPPIAVPCLHSP